MIYNNTIKPNFLCKKNTCSIYKRGSHSPETDGLKMHLSLLSKVKKKENKKLRIQLN